MDPGENFPAILDDAAVGWVNLFLLLDDSKTPWCFLFNPWRSGSGFLLKSAATITLCSTLCLALHRCYKWYHRGVLPPATPSIPPTPVITPTFLAPSVVENSKATAGRHLKMVIVPSPSRGSTMSPLLPLSPSMHAVTDIPGRNSWTTTNVVTVNFEDCESDDDESYGGKVRQQPLLEYKVIVDEVAAEADDESSEHEDEANTDESSTTAPVQTQEFDQERQLDELLQDSQPVNETSEFNLTFGSDAESSIADSESELIYHDDDDDLMGRKITMDLPNHTPAKGKGGFCHTPQERGGGAGLSNRTAHNGYADGGLNRERLPRTGPRRVSLDQFNSAEQDGVVVTNAVVTIG